MELTNCEKCGHEDEPISLYELGEGTLYCRRCYEKLPTYQVIVTESQPDKQATVIVRGRNKSDACEVAENEIDSGVVLDEIEDFDGKRKVVVKRLRGI